VVFTASVLTKKQMLTFL